MRHGRDRTERSAQEFEAEDTEKDSEFNFWGFFFLFFALFFFFFVVFRVLPFFFFSFSFCGGRAVCLCITVSC